MDVFEQRDAAGMFDDFDALLIGNAENGSGMATGVPMVYSSA